jgi:uncharacterized membrane protein
MTAQLCPCCGEEGYIMWDGDFACSNPVCDVRTFRPKHRQRLPIAKKPKTRKAKK